MQLSIAHVPLTCGLCMEYASKTRCRAACASLVHSQLFVGKVRGRSYANRTQLI